MKARFIKTDSGAQQFLYSDGTMANCSREGMHNFLVHFKACDNFTGDEECTWKSESVYDMAMYPGSTLAVITDDYHLVILDFTPFSSLFDNDQYQEDYISAEEYGALYNRSAEIVKVYCRSGRIPGAKMLGTNWAVPSNAPYPTARKKGKKKNS